MITDKYEISAGKKSYPICRLKKCLMLKNFRTIQIQIFFGSYSILLDLYRNYKNFFQIYFIFVTKKFFQTKWTSSKFVICRENTEYIYCIVPLRVERFGHRFCMCSCFYVFLVQTKYDSHGKLGCLNLLAVEFSLSNAHLPFSRRNSFARS